MESWSFLFVFVVDSQVFGGKTKRQRKGEKDTQINNPGFLEPVIPCVGKRTSKEFQTAWAV